MHAVNVLLWCSTNHWLTAPVGLFKCLGSFKYSMSLQKYLLNWGLMGHIWIKSIYVWTRSKTSVRHRQKLWGVVWILTYCPQSPWMRVSLSPPGDCDQTRWFPCWPDRIHWTAWFLKNKKKKGTECNIWSSWHDGCTMSVLQQTARYAPDILIGLWKHGWILWTLSFLSTWSSGDRSKKVNITSDLEYCGVY